MAGLAKIRMNTAFRPTTIGTHTHTRTQTHTPRPPGSSRPPGSLQLEAQKFAAQIHAKEMRRLNACHRTVTHGSSSAGPPAIPGLPVTEGEFPIIQRSPAPHDAVPIPESGSESDSDRTVDYRDDPATLLALVESGDDVLLQLPDDFHVPDFDGDGFASWLTRQDKIKAGSITPEMTRRYAKEIRMAKLDEFKSYLDNGALRLADKRKLSGDVNFLTGRWVLTVKVDKNGYFLKFKARWVYRGFQDKHAWEQQTDSPAATRYGFRLVPQCAANNFWDLFHLDLKTAFLQGEHYNLESRSVVIQLPHDIGLPPWMVGVCLRPVYGLNDAPRRWWNRLDKFLRSIGLEPTRADRCTYVAYQGTEKRQNASIAQEGCGTLVPVPSSGDPGASSYLNEVALSGLNCFAYDEGRLRHSGGTVLYVLPRHCFMLRICFYEEGN